MFNCCFWVKRRKYKAIDKKKNYKTPALKNNDNHISNYYEINCKCDKEGIPIIGTCDCGAWRTY